MTSTPTFDVESALATLSCPWTTWYCPGCDIVVDRPAAPVIMCPAECDTRLVPDVAINERKGLILKDYACNKCESAWRNTMPTRVACRLGKFDERADPDCTHKMRVIATREVPIGFVAMDCCGDVQLAHGELRCPIECSRCKHESPATHLVSISQRNLILMFKAAGLKLSCRDIGPFVHCSCVSVKEEINPKLTVAAATTCAEESTGPTDSAINKFSLLPISSE